MPGLQSSTEEGLSYVFSQNTMIALVDISGVRKQQCNEISECVIS